MEKWVIVLAGVLLFLLVALWLLWVFPYMFLMLHSGLGDTKHIAKLDKGFGFEESKVTDSLSFDRGYFISYSMKYPRLKGKNKLTSRKKHLTMLTSSAFAYSSATLFVLRIGFKPPSLEAVWLLRSNSSFISLSLAASFSDVSHINMVINP